MKADRRPDAYFEKFTTAPVVMLPFDPENKRAAKAYGERLNTVLAPFSARAELFGSTELEIAGKGEWEFAILLDDEHWFAVLARLINHFGTIYSLEEDFALFPDKQGETEIEVIAMRGEAAMRNRAIMQYLGSHPEACAAYEAGKVAHAHSKREYVRWKFQFLGDIVEGL
jgi:GrpB-like predicted nucleotidyltransferase (UPF0157 family)